MASYFQKIESTDSRLEMTQLLAELLKQATPSEARIISTLCMGQLFPPYVGTKFNIAIKTMIKIVAAVLKHEESWVKTKMHKLGDLGSVIAEGVWQSRDAMSVEDLYERLVTIEQMEGVGSVDQKIGALEKLLLEVDPLVAKYIVRIVLGKLRLGFSDMTIIDALSWMAVRDKRLKKDIEYAYNKCADIGLIAQMLKDEGIGGLRTLHVQLGIPIRLAAAERAPTAQAIIDRLGPCVAQPKLDGFRLQIHVDKRGSTPVVRFFSRNLQDMSAMFPDIEQAMLSLPIETLICEGEAIVYDPHTDTFLPFQETVKRKRKHGIEQAIADFPLRMYLFDLLYLDGKSIIDEPHMMRRERLLALFDAEHDDRVMPIDEKHINNAQELEEYFQKTVSVGLEGLVVKRPDSVYTPGKRNFNWIKLKRQETGSLEDTIDTVVLGYYRGSGKRASFGIGAFLVGVFNKKDDRFETVAKVGTGLKDDDWKDLKKRCDERRVATQPKNVVCAKELAPDVWVDPDIVCMIRADEITLSPVHTAAKTDTHLGYALRFPRFMGYRPDKSIREVTDTDELKRLYEMQ